jgi:hypothetical protein
MSTVPGRYGTYPIGTGTLPIGRYLPVPPTVRYGTLLTVPVPYRTGSNTSDDYNPFLIPLCDEKIGTGTVPPSTSRYRTGR